MRSMSRKRRRRGWEGNRTSHHAPCSISTWKEEVMLVEVEVKIEVEEVEVEVVEVEVVEVEVVEVEGEEVEEVKGEDEDERHHLALRGGGGAGGR